MEYVPETKKVLYHGTMNKGKRRNFEIFERAPRMAQLAAAMDGQSRHGE